MREIALFAGAFQLSMRIPLFFAFVRAFCPFVARYVEFGNPIHRFGSDSRAYTVFELYFSTVLIWSNFVFIFAGLVDFHRRRLMMQACGVLLDPTKETGCKLFKIFPTINFLDIRSLHAWYNMRQCLMDLGRRYMKRIFIYSSVFLACYLAFMVYRCLKIFNVIETKTTILTEMFSGFDAFIVLTIILIMLYYGASINNQFVVDQLSLVQLKQAMIMAKKNLKCVLAKSEDELTDSEF